MGEAAHVAGVHAHQLQQFGHPLPQRRPLQHTMDHQRLSDDLLHRMARVERGVRVLEDHLHFGPQAAQFLRAEPSKILPIQDHLSGSGAVELQDGAPGGGFAAAALTHQAQGLPALDLEGDAVHSLDRPPAAAEQAALQGKILLQPAHLEQHLVLSHGAAPHAKCRRSRPPGAWAPGGSSPGSPPSSARRRSRSAGRRGSG